MNIRKKENGFTIIEVVLVLAIAGLIFLMVFIALPALQRSQRDTQRRNDLSRMMSAITSFSSNNRGNIPNATVATLNSFRNTYLKSSGDTFQDPSTGTDYTFNVALGRAEMTESYDSNPGVIYYVRGATCDANDSSAIPASAGGRKVTVRMYLEGGGVACQNN